MNSQQTQSAGRPLSPQNLVEDFGYFGDVAIGSVNTLYNALKDRKNSAGSDSLKQWKRALQETCNIDYASPERWAFELSQKWLLKDYRFSVPKLLFALQTYYAQVVTMLGRRLAPGLPDCEAYCNYSWPEQCAAANSRVAARLAEMEETAKGYEPHTTFRDDTPALDLLQPLYEGLFPRDVRHKLGEYYTPRWLVEHVLDELGYKGNPAKRILDPSCGSGAFLVAAISRIRTYYQKNAKRLGINERGLVKLILENVAGCDVNPLAVLAARTNYLSALGGMRRHVGRREIPVILKDSILDETPVREVDYIAGNPPWINWEHLSPAYRERIAGLWRRYGLFKHKGLAARSGAGKDDLAILMTYAVHDRCLRAGGKLGFVITQSLFKSKGGGRGFRAFAYSSAGRDICVQPLLVDDFSAMRVFPGAKNRTAVLICKKGSKPAAYPVKYRSWKRTGIIEPGCGWREVRKSLVSRELSAEPVDPTDVASPWLTAPLKLMPCLRKVTGASGYRAREGVNCGGMDGCYIVRADGPPSNGVIEINNVHDAGRNKVEAVAAAVESELVYPLVRGRDVSRWRLEPVLHILLPNRRDRFGGIDEKTMREKYPRALAYLQRFEGGGHDPQQGTLRGRPLFKSYFAPGDPFYSLYNTGPYTFVKWKVFWRYIADGMVAVANIAAKPLLIPNTKLMTVACESRMEACYVAAMLNSTPSDLLVRSFTVSTQLAPHILETVRVPRFDPKLKRHAQLADLSLRAHRAAAKGRDFDVAQIEDEIDKLAARIWGLTAKELKAMQVYLGTKKV